MARSYQEHLFNIYMECQYEYKLAEAHTLKRTSSCKIRLKIIVLNIREHFAATQTP